MPAGSNDVSTTIYYANGDRSGGSGSGDGTYDYGCRLPLANDYFLINGTSLNELYPVYNYCGSYESTFYRRILNDGSISRLALSDYNSVKNKDNWVQSINIDTYKVSGTSLTTIKPGTKPSFKGNYSRYSGVNHSRLVDLYNPGTYTLTHSYASNTLILKDNYDNVVMTKSKNDFVDKTFPTRIIALLIGGGGGGAGIGDGAQGGAAGSWVVGVIDIGFIYNGVPLKIKVGEQGAIDISDATGQWWYGGDGGDTSIYNANTPSSPLLKAYGGKGGKVVLKMNTNDKSYESHGASWVLNGGKGAAGGYGTGIGGGRHPGENCASVVVYATNNTSYQSYSPNQLSLGGTEGGTGHNNVGGGGGGASIMFNGGSGAAGNGGSQAAEEGRYGSGGGAGGNYASTASAHGKKGGAGYVTLYY